MAISSEDKPKLAVQSYASKCMKIYRFKKPYLTHNIMSQLQKKIMHENWPQKQKHCLFIVNFSILRIFPLACTFTHGETECFIFFILCFIFSNKLFALIFTFTVSQITVLQLITLTVFNKIENGQRCSIILVHFTQTA